MVLGLLAAFIVGAACGGCAGVCAGVYAERMCGGERQPMRHPPSKRYHRAKLRRNDDGEIVQDGNAEPCDG
jgi:hypothetical protein